jgi:ATP-dependent Clp protease ATP-binding subunit ClpA
MRGATCRSDRQRVLFGARSLARVIENEVRNVLIDGILFGSLEHGGAVTRDVADGRLTFAYR